MKMNSQSLLSRIAELEASEIKLIEERDHAEDALSDMYEAATGERPRWSNWFGFRNAVDEVADLCAEIECLDRHSAKAEGDESWTD